MGMTYLDDTHDTLKIKVCSRFNEFLTNNNFNNFSKIGGGPFLVSCKQDVSDILLRNRV